MLHEPELVPTPPHRVRKLNTLKGVREEMVHCYRAARKGEMRTEDMSRFIFALTAIAKVIEQSDIEQRLERLETSLGKS